jgi:hypothetical protein
MNEMKKQFLTMMLLGMGANIPAPEEIFKQQIENFKYIKSIDESNETLDCLIALDKVEKEQERLEIIKILIMESLTIVTANQLIDDLQKYSVETLEYLKDHEDKRSPNPEEDLRKFWGSLTD